MTADKGIQRKKENDHDTVDQTCLRWPSCPFCAVGYVTQATAADDEALTVTLENDLLTGSDNNYTNGIGVSWVSSDLESYDDDKFVSKWSRFWKFLPFVGDEGYSTYASWTVAQEMHTPRRHHDSQSARRTTNPTPASYT